MNNLDLGIWLSLILGIQASIVYCLRVIFLKINNIEKKLKVRK